MILTSIVNINDTICGCDGSFAIQGFNGFPPYSYSINNGLSFSNTPLFSNLCPGQYSVIVMDVSGNTSTNSVILNTSNNSITYNITLNTSSTTIVDNNTTLTLKYDTTISIFPSLPSGVTLSFNLEYLNTSKSSPFSGSSTTTTTSDLLINNISQPVSYTSSTLSTTYNSTPGCQNQNVFITSTNRGWSNLVYTNSDSLILTTYTTTTKNQDIACYLGQSTESFTLSNVSISGCYCCNIIIT
jgi:hypothetical protein